MNKEDPCDGLLEKKYDEVLGEADLRKQLVRCLNKKIFKIDGAIFHLDEDSLSITFPSEFFNNPLFFWGGRPSETRIRKFYEIMKNIERKFNRDFFVDRNMRPSSTNLNMKVKFYFTKLQKENMQVDEIIIRDVLEHLQALWIKVTYELAVYGYDVRPHAL